MLLYLTQSLAKVYPTFTLFNYLTLRAILAALTALVISFVVGPWMIRTLATRQIGQRVRDDGPKSHLPKAGTPTMGGALILVAIGASTLLWGDLSNRLVWIVLAVTLLHERVHRIQQVGMVLCGTAVALVAVSGRG